MANSTLQDFLADRSLLAVKVASRDLAGFFRKSIVIPRHTTGLAFFADGTSRRAAEGEEVSGKFDLLLAKDGEIPLRFTFPDLRTSDGLPVSASCGLRLALSTGRSDLMRDFCRHLFSYPGTFSEADLRNHVAPEARRLLSGYAASRPAAELHRADHSGTLGPILLDGLERHLFDAGVRCVRIAELDLVCMEYDRRSREERKRRDEDLRAAQVMERKEERLRRLASILKNDDVQGVLSRVPDERLKGLLYAKLMEDDALQVTAEDLVSKAQGCGEEVVRVIYRAMENLLQGGASVAPDEVESSRADRVYAAAGSKVLALDPSGAEPPRIFAFRAPLRSIRGVETPEGPLLLAGAKDRVAAMRPGAEEEIVEYPLPNGRSVRGGINSIAAAADCIFATHSEYGLARWRRDRPGERAELLYGEITGRHRTTRAVQALDGKILFASGNHVYLAPADAAGDPVKFVSSIESPVTCAAAAARTVFAGTENGSIVCWKLDAPDQPVVLARKRDAIVNLRLARICAIPHLIYSARDLSVRARVIGQNLETSYETGGCPVGALDAASDVICASDAEGRRVLLWKSTAPSSPSGQIDVWKQADRPVLDLWMSKVRAAEASHG